jgi:hypothetical protein
VDKKVFQEEGKEGREVREKFGSFNIGGFNFKRFTSPFAKSLATFSTYSKG